MVYRTALFLMTLNDPYSRHSLTLNISEMVRHTETVIQ